MGVLRIILGDQLSLDIAALEGLDPQRDTVLMMEVLEESTYVSHHKQKIVLVLSAMRHFADALTERGVTVDYVKLDAPGNSGSLTTEIQRAAACHAPDSLVVTEPGEWRVEAMVKGWEAMTGRPVEVRADNRFFASRSRFARWAQGRRTWRMEHFYREMRREHAILMEGDQPAGGEWNFDSENRKPLPASVLPPDRRRFALDDTTREVMALVEQRFSGHFGTLEEFGWPVTRADALLALSDFIANGLLLFGHYQDAIKADAPFLFHLLLAPALNIGLLSLREVRAAADSHHIQRLMVTGNLALLAGVAPRDIERWYLVVYADAIEWVEMPNTLGMAVFADGG